MSQDVLLTVMNSMPLIGESVNMERKRNESCDKCFNLDAELFKSQNAHHDLLKSYSQLEKHCISLELSIQLNQEIFKKDESCNNQNALEIPNFFENYDLKAQLQEKDTTIFLPECLTVKVKESKALKDYLGYATSTVLQVARKIQEKPSSKKESELVPGDEEPVKKDKRLKTIAKKSTSKPAIGIVIREPLVETKYKEKEKKDDKQQRRESCMNISKQENESESKNRNSEQDENLTMYDQEEEDSMDQG
ncbi:hypothetical protein Tco_1263096 [Tanacetum coccineum]